MNTFWLIKNPHTYFLAQNNFSRVLKLKKFFLSYFLDCHRALDPSSVNDGPDDGAIFCTNYRRTSKGEEGQHVGKTGNMQVLNNGPAARTVFSSPSLSSGEQ